MRNLSLAIFLSILSSCATTPLEQDAVTKWVGQAGYFTRPIEVAKDSPHSQDAWNHCLLTKIKGFQQIRSENKLVELRVLVEQKGKDFLISSLNRLPIYSFINDSYEVRNLEKFFKPSLKFNNKKIFMKEFGKSISSKKLACNSLIWTGMNREEFLFVKGRPNKIQVPTSSRDQIEDWYYFYSDDPAENKAFRFHKNILQYWKPINPDNKGS